MTKLVLAISFAFFAAACSADNVFTIQSGDATHRFTIEIADTAESRANGLMFRQSMADNEGMLFDFGEEREVAFWMRNTFIPLDMIFIDKSGEIKHIHVNARPHDDTSIPSLYPVRFVLEIPGGVSKELGISVGDVADVSRF